MRIKNFLAILVIGGLITGCGKATYKKSPGGMPYKVFSTNDTQRIFAGNFVKVHFTRVIKDSVDFTTEGSMPVYIPVNAKATPYDLSELWTKLKKGDSVIATQMMDTFIKQNPQYPSFVDGTFKKGDKITTTVKILDVFTSDSAAQLDEVKLRNEWGAKEIENVARYIKDKKINAEKTAAGVYVETITPGTGDLIVPGKYISVNYTGTTFGGFKFDSNTDSAFQHVAPLSFVVGAEGPEGMIKGFDEGVRLMRKGGRARVYMPSMLGYGAQPNPQSGIKPYENLIFDIVVLDIQDKAPAVQSKRPNAGQPQQ